LRALATGGARYLLPRQVRDFDLYLSFTGGPTLRRLTREYGASRARALYCSADPEVYRPGEDQHYWDLGYLGTYCPDRQQALAGLLMASARDWPDGQFVVAGSQYPADVDWPRNVQHIAHVSPPDHRSFYNRQRFTLNVTRGDMTLSGWAPSVRLFEAAACGTPIISDVWWGIDQFFEPDKEILLARSSVHVLAALRGMPEEKRRALGDDARQRVLSEHTPAHRAEAFEDYLSELGAARNRRSRARSSVAAAPGGQS
jgi:spore maturation protein CgeB